MGGCFLAQVKGSKAWTRQQGQHRVRKWQRGRGSGTSLRGKVGDAASLLAKMMAPEENRVSDAPL